MSNWPAPLVACQNSLGTILQIIRVMEIIRFDFDDFPPEILSDEALNLLDRAEWDILGRQRLPGRRKINQNVPVTILGFPRFGTLGPLPSVEKPVPRAHFARLTRRVAVEDFMWHLSSRLQFPSLGFENGLDTIFLDDRRYSLFGCKKCIDKEIIQLLANNEIGFLSRAGTMRAVLTAGRSNQVDQWQKCFALLPVRPSFCPQIINSEEAKVAYDAPGERAWRRLVSCKNESVRPGHCTFRSQRRLCFLKSIENTL